MRRVNFSIRHILAGTFLVALGLFAWRAIEDTEAGRARVRLLESQMDGIRKGMWLHHPEKSQASVRDEYAALREMRERADAHFGLVREKDIGLEPRAANSGSPGEGPWFDSPDDPSAILRRLIVPEDRPIWLKCGVHGDPNIAQSAVALDEREYLESNAPLLPSGPFEMRLPPGNHLLRLAVGPIEDDRTGFVVTFDGQVVLRSRYSGEDAVFMDWTGIARSTQQNLRSQQALPCLVTVGVNRAKPKQACGFSIWLSDRPSGFKEFPAGDQQ